MLSAKFASHIERVSKLKFSGYEIFNQPDGVVAIRCIELDETELTPESDWMEGYPNTDPSEGLWVGRSLDAALAEIRRRILS
jgi:hypothetical protein